MRPACRCRTAWALVLYGAVLGAVRLPTLYNQLNSRPLLHTAVRCRAALRAKPYGNRPPVLAGKRLRGWRKGVGDEARRDLRSMRWLRAAARSVCALRGCKGTHFPRHHAVRAAPCGPPCVLSLRRKPLTVRLGTLFCHNPKKRRIFALSYGTGPNLCGGGIYKLNNKKIGMLWK